MSNNTAGHQGPPKHILVVIPGYMGSKLRDKKTGEIVWIDLPAMARNPLKMGSAVDNLFKKMAYPNDDLEPAGIVDQVLIVPPWAKQEQYGRLTVQLARWGYSVDPQTPDPDALTAYTFSYDWRQDNRISGRQLGEAVERWRSKHPGAEVWLLGHSNGGIIARWYVEKEGGKEFVTRMFLMGSPWDGAPKALRVLTQGFSAMGLRRFNLFNVSERSKDLIRSFPSYYHLIPNRNPFVRNDENQDLDLFKDTRWLGNPADLPYLMDGLKFNQELGTTLSVESVCFFGRFKSTTTSGIVHVEPGGQWSNIQWIDTIAGDATVPERSAVHPQAKNFYAFCVEHGSIYVDPQMLAQLEWELHGKYQLAERAAIMTERLAIVFEPEQVFYDPGGKIDLWMTVNTTIGESKPLSGAEASAQLVWRGALPGDESAKSPTSLPRVALRESKTVPGRYEGSLTAPLQQGYYKVRATVQITGEPTYTLDELISIEAE